MENMGLGHRTIQSGACTDRWLFDSAPRRPIVHVEIVESGSRNDQEATYSNLKPVALALGHLPQCPKKQNSLQLGRLVVRSYLCPTTRVFVCGRRDPVPWRRLRLVQRASWPKGHPRSHQMRRHDRRTCVSHGKALLCCTRLLVQRWTSSPLIEHALVPQYTNSVKNSVAMILRSGGFSIIGTEDGRELLAALPLPSFFELSAAGLVELELPDGWSPMILQTNPTRPRANRPLFREVPCVT
jgi:hypothetical protein